MGLGNSFGDIFKITTFGESHGPAVGVTIEGLPAGLSIDTNNIKKDLIRRKPGQSKITTTRNEPENFQILSGFFEGKTTGTPLTIVVFNKDQKSKDYDFVKNTFRPSHSDYTYFLKYRHYDYRGGGRSSARETLARVIAGNIAKQLLKKFTNIEVLAFVEQIYNIAIPESLQENTWTYEQVESNIVRCPHQETAEKMIKLIEKVRAEGDSVGGIIKCIVQNPPAGLGEPVFDKLSAKLAYAMMSIPATKGFEIGKGFNAPLLKGSQHNDQFTIQQNQVKTKTNLAGGIQGGISNGENIYFRVAFKPTSTIAKKQQTVDRQGNIVEIRGKGRHDPCVLPRAVPIIEAMTYIVLADMFLKQFTRQELQKRLL